MKGKAKVFFLYLIPNCFFEGQILAMFFKLLPYQVLYMQSHGGDLTKTSHKAQPPHEVSTPFHCSHQIILPSLYTGKNPLKLP